MGSLSLELAAAADDHVQERVPYHDPRPVVGTVALGLPPGFVVEHIAGGVDDAPGRAAELLDVRHHVSHHELVPHPLDVLPLLLAVVLLDGEPLGQHLIEPALTDGGVGVALGLLVQLDHVTAGQLQCLLGLQDLAVDVAGVHHRPGPPGPVERQIERVVADDADRRHADLDRAAAIVGVGEAQIRLHLVPCHLGCRHPGKEPHLAAAPQGAGRFIADIATDQVVGEGEGFLILHHPVLVRDNAQHLTITVPGIRHKAGDLLAVGIVDGAPLHLPVQARQPEGILAGGGFGHHRAQAVPGHLADIHHRLNICGHFGLLSPLLCSGGCLQACLQVYYNPMFIGFQWIVGK